MERLLRAPPPVGGSDPLESGQLVRSLVLGALAYGMVGYFLLANARGGSRAILGAALGAWALAAASGWLSGRAGTPRAIAVAGLAVSMLLGFGVWWWIPASQGWIIVLWGVGTASNRFATGFAVGAAAAGYAAFAAVTLRRAGGSQVFNGSLIWPAVTIGAILVIGIQRKRQREYVDEMRELVAALRAYSAQLEEAHRQLQVQSRQAVALAAAEERNRIAREIHDVLAHALTVIVVQAQAIKLLVRSDPGAAAEHADTVAQLAREGLQEARRSVAALRSEAAAGGIEALRGLVEEFGRRAEVTTRFAVDGDGRDLSPDAWSALQRITQEALTNACRHGRARVIDVRLELGPPRTRLSIEDDGDATPGDAVVAGNGLSGMRERAARLGGSVAYGPRPARGFRIDVELPG